VTILEDGTINLALVGAFRAARMTLPQLEQELNRLYVEFVPDARITITPIQVNTRLDDILNTVDRRAGTGGTLRQAVISADGTIQLPALSSVPAQGLTKTELQNEVNARYAEVVQGLEVTVAITAFAPTSVYVLGEVATPGRYPLQGPTTVMQSIALAGGWNRGGNLREIVVFRRTEDWRLVATRLDLRGALLGKRPTPADELWVRDSDIVLVPKNPLQRVDDAISLIFTQGVYGVLPNERFGFFTLTGL
jgi:polysaccharide export outer membrane protein